MAYEAMAWSTINHHKPDARKTLQQVGEENRGMVIDAFHICVRKRSVADLDDIPAERIFLVQLSDLDHDLNRGNLIETARHHRLLPGQGHFFLLAIKAKGSAGALGREVFNDDFRFASRIKAGSS